MASRSSSKSPSRYEIREVIGEGGMGLVYRAFDQIMRREVTLKTIRDAQDSAVLELFRRECDVLGSMAHPNIVEIFDIGEMEVDGARRPYFVMPFLRGVTLDKLIRSASSRLSIERIVQMVTQICRGLQAAHDQGLVHRDLKPANIFVLEDDSIKIIDFGVAHLIDQHSATGLKGTLLYMAPEQLQHPDKKPTAVSDQFALAVTTYEMLTLRHPFYVPGLEDLASAIVNHTPPPASEINPLVPAVLSQVIHKALTKEPFHRLASVREYADCLQKALRNEPIEIFDSSRVEPRLVRAQKAFNEGDWDFAGEIIRELKSESYLNPEIDRLDKEVSDAIRNRNVRQLLETARRRFEENEHILALQKVQEVLDLDPANIDALKLRNSIEGKRSSAQVDDWLRLAQQHLDNRAYSHARDALNKLLNIQAYDARARALLAEVDRREQEFSRLRVEKQRAYDSALDAYKRGDVNTALSKLERCLEADRQSPGGTSSEQAPAYQKLYDEVRSKRDQLKSSEQEARLRLAEGKYESALAVCATVLKDFPANVVFQVLRDDAEQGLRQETSAYVAKVEKAVAEEPDLNRKVAILEEAQLKYAQEQRFEHSLKQVLARKHLVDSIVARAQSLEEAGNFPDALAQWETLGNIHPQYPGLKVEIERLTKRRHQQTRVDAKANWVAQIDQVSNVHDYTRAAHLIKDALAEFPGDTELISLEETILQLGNRQSDAERQIALAAEMEAQGNLAAALDTLRAAFQAAPHRQSIRNGLLDLLLKQAGNLLDSNYAEAEPLVEEAFTIEPKNALARSLRTLINDKKQAEEVAQILARARSLQGQARNRDAIKELDQSLLRFPREPRLIQLRAALAVSLSPQEREELRNQDLQELRTLEEASRTTMDAGGLDTIFQRTRVFKSKYADDRDFTSSIATIEERITAISQPKVSVEPVRLDAGGGAGRGNQGGWVKSRKAGTAPSRKTLPNWTSSRQVQIGFGIAGALVAGLLLYLGISFSRASSRSSAPPVAQTAAVASLAVTGPQTAYTIVNAAGQDVTSTASGGLTAGEYHFRAARPGFAPIDMPFTVNPGANHVDVAPVWQSLPAHVTLFSYLGSSAHAGEVNFVSAGKGMLVADLPEGMHTLEWSAAGYTGTADVSVKDGSALVSNWNLKGGRGFAAVLDGINLRYEAINFGDNIKVGDKTAPSQSFEPNPGQPLIIASLSGTRLAAIAPVDVATYSSGVFISVFPPARATPGKAASPDSQSATPAQLPVTSPEPAAPPETPVQKRQRELKEELERLANQGKK